MRQSRFTEEQIIAGLKEAEAGVKVGEICRKEGICEPTYYRWKAKYGGLEVSEARQTVRLQRAIQSATGTAMAAVKDVIAQQGHDMLVPNTLGQSTLTQGLAEHDHHRHANSESLASSAKRTVNPRLRNGAGLWVS